MQDIAEDIVVRAQAGSMKAFEEIYAASSGFVYNVSYRITANTQDAEEATQDTFLKIYRNLKTFRFRSSFTTWVYRIAVNAAINVYEKRSRDLSRRADYDDGVDVGDPRGAAQKGIDKEDNEALVKSMLGVLNPDQRACVVLRNIEGLSYREIVEALNVNINTVRSRLKRARAKLLAFRQKGVI